MRHLGHDRRLARAERTEGRHRRRYWSCVPLLTVELRLLSRT